MSAKQVNYEMIVCNFTRNEYENKFNRVNVPMPLKYLIVAFSKPIIGSNILTLKEDTDFVKSVLTRIPNMKRFHLLFRASDHGFQAKDFHQKCDNKNGASITIIKSNWQNIFGGYTTVPWTSDGPGRAGMKTDQDAFLFLIRSSNDLQQKECPLLFDIKQDKAEYAVRHHPNFGPRFGVADIFINNACNDINPGTTNNVKYRNITMADRFEYNNFKGILCNGNRSVRKKPTMYFQVLEYEVFQIKSANC